MKYLLALLLIPSLCLAEDQPLIIYGQAPGFGSTENQNAYLDALRAKENAETDRLKVETVQDSMKRLQDKQDQDHQVLVDSYFNRSNAGLGQWIVRK